MHTLGTIGKFALSPLLAIATMHRKAAAAPAAAAPLIATRDGVREGADRRDEFRRRRGGAADIVTGAYGAEAAPGTVGKATLGS